MSDVYSKLVTARHSPQNNCFAADGAVLLVLPKANVPLKDSVSHHFVDSPVRGKKSRYGWVTEVAPFTLEEFMRRHIAGGPVPFGTSAHIEMTLHAVSRLAPGTPVVVEYSRRLGDAGATMELGVHRVIFYPYKQE